MAAASMKRAGKVSDMEARDSDGVVFKRLAHDFEYVARKLRELVEEEKTVVRQGDFSGARNDTATDKAGVGDRVVRRAERALCDETLGGVEDSGDGVNLGSFEGFLEGERRQDGGQAFCQYGFA
jgi:hypothetical protein